MLTPNQTELIASFMDRISGDEKALYEPIIAHLLELGYIPKKHSKSSFTVAFGKNGRTISKLEIGRDSDNVIFWLRFSACESYSEIFKAAAARRPEAWVKRGQEYVSHNVENCCGNCKGEPRMYHFTNDAGERIVRCGGYTLQVPGVSSADVPEILRLINEQDLHLGKLTA